MARWYINKTALDCTTCVIKCMNIINFYIWLRKSSIWCRKFWPKNIYLFIIFNWKNDTSSIINGRYSHSSWAKSISESGKNLAILIIWSILSGSFIFSGTKHSKSLYVCKHEICFNMYFTIHNKEFLRLLFELQLIKVIQFVECFSCSRSYFDWINWH